VWGPNLRIFIDGVHIADMPIPLTSGRPGIGGTPGGAQALFRSFFVGHRDTVAPTPIPSGATVTSVLPTSVSMRWPLTADDSIGIGMYRYQIFRNGGSTPIGYALGNAFADYSAIAGTPYTYQICPEDQHGTVAAGISVNVTTPPATSVDPRRTGVRTTGSYWGGGLNYSLPLFSVQQRTGQKISLNLTYNSQNWRQDSGSNWQLGYDNGYGFGWKLQFGSLMPFYGEEASGVDHYLFTDGSGAEYRLTVNNGGVWSSSESVYVWFDSNTGRLHFKDGGFWIMGCTSAGTEPDAGTMYPTTIEDVNGNQIQIQYMWAASVGQGSYPYNRNSSARLYQITDITGTYSPVYNADSPVPHLASISGTLGTFTPHYLLNSPLSPPFGTDPAYAGATTSLLSSLAVPGGSQPYSFTYDSASAAELLKVSFPYGGFLSWNYGTFQYTGTRSMREVAGRYLDYAINDTAESSKLSYTISRDDSANPNPVVHANMTVVDSSGVGAKTWSFFTANSPGISSSPWEVGLLSSFVQQSAVGGTVLQRDTFTWAQDTSAFNGFISSKTSTLDESGSNPQIAYNTQVVDQYGNVAQSTQFPYQYPFNSGTAPIRTYANSYLHNNSYIGSYYTPNYILNRLTTTVLTLPGNITKTLVANGYGAPFASGVSGLMDPNPPAPPAYRGLLTQSQTPAISTTIYNWDTGNPANIFRSDGTTASMSADAGTNYAAPMSIGSESYSETVSYNSWLGVTQTTGANGETLAMTYDGYGHPHTATSAYGGVTTYTYSAAGVLPAWQQESGPNGITTTTLDGIGRVVLVARGDSSGVKSYVKTVYAPCACSPLGKIYQVSQPYPPSGTPVWTTYTYDGLGRTLTVQQPDAASTTTYVYSGNQTKVTDPAGNWKSFAKDVLGNLTSVLEPDPSSNTGGTLATSYTYDWMNHVSQVSMTRGGTTQTRTFIYNDSGLLTSATNPENGTVHYYYNSDNTLQYKLDAKGTATVYTYGGARRVTMVQTFPMYYGQVYPNAVEDTCAQVTYTYGTNPAAYSYGRLVSVQHPYGACWTGGVQVPSYAESYSYDAPGNVLTKVVSSNAVYYGTLQATYTYDSYGRQTSVTTPFWGPITNYLLGQTFTTGYDSMGRPNSLTDSYATPWVQNVAYDYAGRLQSMQVLNTTESHSYNTSGQLTSLNWSVNGGPATGLQYTYSATQNNGQITQMTDTLSGETIVYQYDSLKRLTSASSTPGSGSSAAPWTQQFGYDGFGNLTGKTTNGTLLPIAVNAATNQLSSAYYDANGNMFSGAGATITYTEDNRMLSATETGGGTEYYWYAPDGKRIWRQMASGTHEFMFYGARGELLGTFMDSYGSGPIGIPQSMNVYFAGKLIWQGPSTTLAPPYGNGFAGIVMADRLGTNRDEKGTDAFL
jgi:YD repeat-containing protein